ncbi:MAG: serine/threonine-protein kinase, partial [Deltaproteobacteria bacterium]
VPLGAQIEASSSVAGREGTLRSLGDGARAAPAAVTPTLPDRYALGEKLGQGAMGTVYRATDLLLGREVAVKLLGSVDGAQAQELFLREARAMAAVSHPNVVTLFDAGIAQGTPYLVMELVLGRSLRNASGDQPVPEHRALHWAAELADALCAVHARRLVHRDVKPENAVLIEGTERVKLMDFGVAHALRTEARTGPSGTPDYMAPEQILGQNVGPWTDVYALGATLYQLLTAQVVFPVGEPFFHAMHTAPEDPMVRVPTLRPETSALVLACLAKDATLRPTTAQLQGRLRALARAA